MYAPVLSTFLFAVEALKPRVFNWIIQFPTQKNKQPQNSTFTDNFMKVKVNDILNFEMYVKT